MMPDTFKYIKIWEESGDIIENDNITKNEMDVGYIHVWEEGNYNLK